MMDFADVTFVVLGLALQEGMGALFGVGVSIWSVWWAYQRVIKVVRDERDWQFQDAKQDMHRRHWKQIASRTKRPRS